VDVYHHTATAIGTDDEVNIIAPAMLKRIEGTRGTSEMARSYMALDWMVSVYATTWLWLLEDMRGIATDLQEYLPITTPAARARAGANLDDAVEIVDLHTTDNGARPMAHELRPAAGSLIQHSLMTAVRSAAYQADADGVRGAGVRLGWLGACLVLSDDRGEEAVSLCGHLRENALDLFDRMVDA
tara:strand:- start:3 stop:557 length:555 start_codon:yes stop_codon:yes gene_type:complete